MVSLCIPSPRITSCGKIAVWDNILRDKILRDMLFGL